MRRDEGRLAHGLEILCYEWERTRARASCSGDAAPVHPTQAPAFQRWEGGGARATRRRPAAPFARRCASGTGPTPSPLESRRLLGLGWTFEQVLTALVVPAALAAIAVLIKVWVSHSDAT